MDPTAYILFYLMMAAQRASKQHSFYHNYVTENFQYMCQLSEI